VPAIPKPSPASVTRAIQRELARLGIYTDTIDGMAGPRTRAAISRWQSAGGMVPTGEPTPELLAALRQPASSIRAAPVTPVETVDAPSDAEVAAAEQRAAELEREQATARQAATLRRVQTALDQIGYGPLAADGVADEQTGEALRRFQLDNGLTPDGVLSDKVMQRLVAIGALQAE
jgi:peptidoglycan hydrolase-like protein with peptidoglycan-binding domain